MPQSYLRMQSTSHALSVYHSVVVGHAHLYECIRGVVRRYRKGSSMRVNCKAPLFAARDGRTPSMRGSLPLPLPCSTARTPDFRGHIAARRRYVPVKTRWETRKAFEIGRDPRFMALLNLLRSEQRAGKVEHTSRAPCLKGTVDLACMPNDPPFILV